MRVLILGAAARSSEDEAPVWIAELNGEVLVERFVRACARLAAKLIFAVRQQDVRRYHIDSVIEMAAPGSAVVAINGETQGAPCTALLCVDLLDPDDELLVLNSNEFLDIDYRLAIDDFKSRNLDAGAITFQSIHPRYSYMLLDEQGLIVEAAEKKPISRNATAGFYWYRCAADFIKAAEDMIRKDTQVDGRFFMSLTFNELVLQHKRMGIFAVNSRHYRPLKSQTQVAAYEGGAEVEARP